MVRSIEAHAFAPFGRVIDVGTQLGVSEPGFWSAETAFVSASPFDPGADGEVDLLWVTYDRVERPTAFEAHLLTEQALIPISGSIVQHVFRPDHNGGRVESFAVNPGQGIVMNRGCFHTTTSVNDHVVCLMVSRASTTRDLADSLQEHRQPTESLYVDAR
ncbi:MAG: hypothetical protein ACTH2Q_07940 [Propionibacteriaceae bacterium]